MIVLCLVLVSGVRVGSVVLSVLPVFVVVILVVVVSGIILIAVIVCLFLFL